MRNHPGFAALAILTLALGIGAATTIYSVIYNVLFDPFPYKEANRVVQIQIRSTDRPHEPRRGAFQTAEFLDYKEQSTVFEDVIGGTFEDTLFTRGDGTELLTGGLVTVNNFSFLGVPALHGRHLLPEDAKPGAPPVFVISYKMWRKYFNLDPTVLGQTFTLNGTLSTLVGIMPPRFTKLNADVYRPIVMDRADPQAAQRFFMFQARLKPGITVEKAEAELGVLAKQLSSVYPRGYPENGKFFVKIVSWVDNILGPFRNILYMLAAAVAMLLLIACTNVANMLLARAATRDREMAIRASLGASRWMLVRQLLVESLLLALGGMLLGWALAYFGVEALKKAIPEGAIPHEVVIKLNGPVLIISIVTSVATALVFGLVPALQASRRDLVDSLKDGTKGTGGGFRGGYLRKGLVVLEVALSLVLLLGAGLLMRSFVKRVTVDLGFEPDKILFARLPLPRGQYQTPEKKLQFFNELLPRIRALPGVKAATVTTSLPPFGGGSTDIEISGRPATQERLRAAVQLCSAGYFETMGIRLLRGRLLSDVDVDSVRKVVVVNETFVKRFLPNEDPIGRIVSLPQLKTLRAGAVADPSFEIIGVVSDIRNDGVEDPTAPEIIAPYAITGAFDRSVMLRTVGDPLPLVNTLRREIWAGDRNVAVTDTDTLANFLGRFAFARPRFTLLVLGVFAVVGLVLVALGIYSVMAYTVTRQTHEIGIRMALGATRGDVLKMVMSLGAVLIALGVCFGALISTGVSFTAKRVLANELWDVETYDPVTVALVLALVVIVGAVACFFPAWRATRVPPSIALRTD